MSFGFGIGDLIQLVKTVDRIRKSLVGAPAQFRAISDEVRALSHIVQDLEDVILERVLSSDLSKALEQHVESCRQLLAELETHLGGYHALDHSDSRRKRIWHRLKWEPGEIAVLRTRISSNMALLNGILNVLNRETMSHIESRVEKLATFQEEEENLRILSWLSTVDVTSQHSDIMRQHHSGTSGWFLCSREYSMWLESLQVTLFCPGIPGAGKTMIAATVVQDLLDKFEPDATVGVAVQYCSYKTQHEQTLENFLASLLKQLIQQCGDMPASLRKLCRSYSSRMTRPTIDELTSLLLGVCAGYSKIYLVIDALDEYSKASGAVESFVRKLAQVQSTQKVNILVTLRPHLSDLKRLFDRTSELEISAKDEDVLKVLESEMPGMPTCIAKDPELQALIIRHITILVNGMFLLARLHLNSLRDKLRKKHVIQALQNLPRGKEALSAAYAGAIERIEEQSKSSCELAKRVLAWVSHTRVPLTTTQLQHALAVEPDDAELDEDNFPATEDMISFCEGLVVIDEKSNIIRLVHLSTQEFFEGVGKFWTLNPHEDIALTCLSYLSFEEFGQGSCTSDKQFEERLVSNDMLEYCAQFWGDHVRLADSEGVDENALEFLADQSRLASAAQVRMVTAFHFAGYSTEVPLEIHAIHLAAQFGLRKVLVRLLDNDTNPDLRDDFGRTPLSYAAEYGHPDVVDLLILRQDVYLNSGDRELRTPLSWAAGSGHVDIIQSLLRSSEVDVNARDAHGMCPLAWAANRGFVDAVRFLIMRNDVEINAHNNDGQTPLSWAAYNGHLEVVKLLVASPQVKVEMRDSFSLTPLSWAARNGHVDIVSFLCNLPNVNPDIPDDDDRTPLMWACIHGHLEVAKLLTALPNIRCETKDRHGQTPLSWAAREGHLPVVKFLIERDDIDVRSKDATDRTPSRWAAWNGYHDIVTVLAAKGRRRSSATVTAKPRRISVPVGEAITSE